MKAGSKPRPAFDLHVELVLEDRNAVRKIRVGANITFERLHRIIQAAYQWQDSHLYEFRLYKEGVLGEDVSVDIVMEKDPDLDRKKPRLARRAKLCDYLHEHRHMLYLYDFGDYWEHCIDVVGSSDDYEGELPELLAGENDAPPEDVGGTTGFARFLEIMGQPEHEEHEDMKGWAESLGWERFNFARASLRVYLAGNPGRGVWVKEDS